MRLFTIAAVCASASLFFTGCYKYEKPAAATLEKEFQQRKRDGADDLLKDVKLLTIENAQRIALANNPDYLTDVLLLWKLKKAHYWLEQFNTNLII